MNPPLTSEGFMPYPIIVERGSTWRLPQIMANRANSRRLVIVTDKELAAHYQEAIRERFKAAGIQTHILLIDGSEAGKTVDSVRSLYEQLSDMEMSVNDLFVAFGGGSVIDVAGFEASTFLGGLDHILVPTSLLAMADSSTSLNCRLNYRTSKNLLGMSCQPKMVLIDVDLLKTLPPKHLANGYAQIIQYGYVQDPEIIDMLESGGADTERLLQSAMAAKLEMLSDNPATLDFGKPVGNAIEGHFRFLKYLYGEALALGMLAISPSDRLRKLLSQYHLPTRLEGVSSETLIRRMQRADAQKGATVKLVRVEEPGKPYIQEVNLDQTDEIYQEFMARLTGAV